MGTTLKLIHHLDSFSLLHAFLMRDAADLLPNMKADVRLSAPVVLDRSSVGKSIIIQPDPASMRFARKNVVAKEWGGFVSFGLWKLGIQLPQKTVRCVSCSETKVLSPTPCIQGEGLSRTV